MKKREENIANLIDFFSNRSKGFTQPKIITIGGYALRAFVPFRRYSRDWDFIMKKKNRGWNLDTIKEWVDIKMSVVTFKKEKSYGFLRGIKFIRFNGKPVKVSFDFMEGEVRGRTEKDCVVIDNKFIQECKKADILVGNKNISVLVPSYTDYLILKITSARASDVRDIATLIWKLGVPTDLRKRSKEVLPYTEIFTFNIKNKIIPIISDKRFLDSWKGTFITKEFTEDSKKEILDIILAI
jgi:hypothetical protein